MLRVVDHFVELNDVRVRDRLQNFNLGVLNWTFLNNFYRANLACLCIFNLLYFRMSARTNMLEHLVLVNLLLTAARLVAHTRMSTLYCIIRVSLVKNFTFLSERIQVNLSRTNFLLFCGEWEMMRKTRGRLISLCRTIST